MSRPDQVASTPIPASDIQMLESSLASLLTEGIPRGHRKVALQRMLMLDAQHHAVPGSEREFCDQASE